MVLINLLKVLFLIQIGLSVELNSDKKFPAPRHILSDISSNDESPNSQDLPRFFNPDVEQELTTESENLSIFGDSKLSSCTKPSRCEPLPPNATCFDTSLPYSSVSYSFTGLHHYWEVQSRLSAWAAMKHIPKCWAVIQQLLCAVYLPKCEDNQVELVAKHLCKVTRGPCRIVESVHQDGWPDFLRCNNASVFRSESNSAMVSASSIMGNNGQRKKVAAIHGEEEFSCHGDQSERRLLRFNTSSSCFSPYLVRTSKPGNFYDVIDECGLNCFSPQYTTDEHESILSLNRWLAWAGLICSLSVFLTTILIQRSKRIRQSVTNHIIMCMSVCSIFMMVGILAPTLSEEYRRDILCQSDGTRRILEPDSSQTSSCTVIAFFIYSGAIGYGVWLLIFAFAWSINFSRMGKMKDDGLEKRKCTMLIVAWCIPFVMTITLFVTNAAEADSLSGVCFVGGYVHTSTVNHYDPSNPVWFVILPFVIIFTLLSVAVAKILFDLHKAYQSADMVTPEKAGYLLKTSIVKLTIIYIPALFCIITTFVHHIHIFNNSQTWAQSLKDFLVCSTLKSFHESSGDVNCELKDRLSTIRIRFQLYCIYVPPLQLFCLIFNKATYRLWQKFIVRNLCNRWKSSAPEHNSPGKREKIKVGAKKHQLIAQAYLKRLEFRDTGRLSLTFNSLHENPLGLALSQLDNKNSEGLSSNELSSSWAAALPRLIERRNGCADALALGLKRSDSIDSKLHLSSCVSVRSNGLSWSRQNSVVDSQASQLSIQHTQDYLHQKYRSGLKHSRSSRKRKSNFFRSRRFGSRLGSRQSSFTSHDNSGTSQVLPAITLDPSLLEERARKNIYGRLGSALPPPGKSLDVGPMGVIKDLDRELEEKLRHLAEASRTSHETFLPDEAPGNNMVSTSVQTSLTDLTQLGKRPELKTSGTQWSPHPQLRSFPTTSTTSSSQTETHFFLSKHEPHIETNVIKISVQHQKDSSAESSIPSSYEKLTINNPGPFKLPPSVVQPPYTLKATPFVLPPGGHEASHFNRGRRGGLVSDDPPIIHPTNLEIGPKMLERQKLFANLDLRHLEEIELKVRTPGRNTLDLNPDSIVAISTPSS